MGDHSKARAHMVESQVRTSSVSDWRILARMGEVPREDFVAPTRRAVAYVDDIQWLGGRFMAPPALLAKLLQLARIAPTDHVLIIGAGSGYTTALVAGLAASVTGLEPDLELAGQARDGLSALANATIVHAPFTEPPAQAFDVIVVEGALADVPESYRSALKDHGRLVVPLLRNGVPVAHLFERAGTEWYSRAEFKAALPLLMPLGDSESFVF